MSRLICSLLFFVSIGALAEPDIIKPPELKKPVHELFNHAKHEKIMKSSGVTCVSCHSFGVKSERFDPLAPNVAKGFLAPSKKTCHECHTQTVSFPRPNQCTLCHKQSPDLKPSNHDLNWRKRHGWFAQQKASSCVECHSDVDNSCAACHTQRDTLKPAVHPPNFRMTHSISARANPVSCVTCHSASTNNTCISCHTGWGK
jgi:hypothetical protein